MQLVDSYIDYMGPVRRRSERTLLIYRDAVESFFIWYFERKSGDIANLSDSVEPKAEEMAQILTLRTLRNWRHYMLTEKKYSARTVNQHLSAMSGFCRWLFNREIIAENPFNMLDRNGRSAVDGVKLRDEHEKRVAFFTDEALEQYLRETRSCADGSLQTLYAEGAPRKDIYDRICRRMIVSFLYGTALRRAELISLTNSSFDWSRKVLTVKGKGGKTRQVALTDTMISELKNYRSAVETMVPAADDAPASPFFVTFAGKALYPVYLDRAVKTELGGREDCPGHKSPHVIRHSLATELLKEGADIYSVGRYLGHSSIAATQIYTHGDIKQLKEVYAKSFPRSVSKEEK